MADSYVIDGYNLIHALGMIRKNLEPGGLEESRRQLLAFLVKTFGAAAVRVTVVFDAKQAPRGAPRQHVHLGLHVHFAPKNQSADDWIETLIAQATQPRQLVVVSNDMRLQTAATRRGAKAWSHDALLDFLEKNQEPAGPSEQQPPHEPSPEEKKHWLREFETLESDPSLKEFFDHNRFEN